MNTQTKVFLKKAIKDYYFRHGVKPPSQVNRREFGVGTLDDKIKFRHKGFASGKQLAQYLKTEAPYYISYSSAYYEYPENQPMEKKNWLGADLVFDLDKPMDALRGKELGEVKEETASIIDFLKDDFGFTSKEISVNFSGSKGYHVHVDSDDVRGLSGQARREIVDYMTGTGLDIRYFIKEEAGLGGIAYRRGKTVGESGAMVGPKAGSRGWAKRIYDVTHELVSLPPEELVKVEGIGEKTAEKVAAKRETNLRFLSEGKWDALFAQLRGNIQLLIYSKAVEIKDADKQVTLDTSRLIRLPDTIHGGSGLLAAKATDFDGFNPLTDAVAFGDTQVKATMTKDAPAFELMENKYGPFKSGDTLKLPEYAAVYLMLKDAADVAT